MLNRSILWRYLLIIRKISASPFSTFEELNDHLIEKGKQLRWEEGDLSLGLTKRTLQRDFASIRENFNIQITYSRPEKGYFIESGNIKDISIQNLLDSFDLQQQLINIENSEKYIEFDQKKTRGNEEIHTVLRSIRHSRKITFHHQGFWSERASQRTVEPYGLKEFKNRWYLVGKDSWDNQIKTFGLDRIFKMESTEELFIYPHGFDLKTHFRDCFGIISDETEPKKVVLQFEPNQGKYIKTMPLHPSQKILLDNNEELIVEITVYQTRDLIMEILSYGDRVIVLEPKELVQTILKELKGMVRNYQQ